MQRFLTRLACQLAYLTIVGVVILGNPAKADVTLVKSADPIEHHYPGVRLKIDGVGLGMSVEEVRTILLGRFPGANITTTTQVFKATSDILQLQTSPFISKLSIPNFDVYFGSPATGSTVVSLMRFIAPGDATHPIDVQSQFQEFGRIFGPPSGPPTSVQSRSIQTTWTLDADKLVPCSGIACGTASPVPLDLDATIEDADLGHGRHLIVSAIAVTAGVDHDKTERMFVAMDDIENRALAEHEASKQLGAALAAHTGKSP